jgi:hypothetical protein
VTVSPAEQERKRAKPRQCKRQVYDAENGQWVRCQGRMRFVANDVAVGHVCDGCGHERVIEWKP